MLELTVSKDNYEAMLFAQPDEEILIRHIERGRKVGAGIMLHKKDIIDCPVEMTIREIEEALGHKVKIIGGV